MKIRFTFLLISLCLIFCCVTAFADNADNILPVPEWVTVISNTDGSKTVKIDTPTSLLDSVDSYRYSTDGGKTWQNIYDNTGGDVLLTESGTFVLTYMSGSNESAPYTIEIETDRITAITNTEAGVTLILHKNSQIPKDISLACYEVMSGSSYTVFRRFAGENNRFAMFNVYLTLGGEVRQYEETKSWIFPTGDFDTRYCRLYHISSGGIITEIASEINFKTICAQTPLTGTFAVIEDKTHSPGDVNGDAKVNAADARLALRASAQLEELDSKQIASADIDNDGAVTSSDARTILRIAANLEAI